MPRSRYRVVQNPSPHFLTATINSWLPLFTRPETVNIVLDSWRFYSKTAVSSFTAKSSWKTTCI
ncbi:hypothetical protein [Methylomonas albis]|uniref:hypothetical protein n=1 Tax=Methylomonas albis TaxID=1854563 RepID=UPI0038994498